MENCDIGGSKEMKHVVLSKSIDGVEKKMDSLKKQIFELISVVNGEGPSIPVDNVKVGVPLSSCPPLSEFLSDGNKRFDCLSAEFDKLESAINSLKGLLF